ncbi:ras guanine nucleotide exchange factor domain-containing protein [Halteromyces radiatus]|uniref:ras guanine nucleotide exchange factor domain-containing protein n=1 Tax=Halteromyces radiatus TaxID=101107 RepID=UPI00221E8CEE|nr:ras guanine nucleotide exchange factor domain-containing protein [Halteromyces radiatus]KAI8097061.1 ras guanine nucleotide exchange factor domain-containing protein [Halteromyces radiatus]
MDIPNHHTWHSSSTHQHHQSKDIISAIIAAAKYPENASFGWVGIEEEQTLDTRPNSPPPPPLPIENDTHIFDLLALDDNAYFIHYSQRADQPSAMNSATVEKLVEILTKGMDSDLMMNFFLTFRQFLTPIKLCKLLILRFRWALLEDSDDRRLVRIRTFVVLRYWITHYWEHDFIMSRTLRFMLCTFLSQLRTHPVILNSPRDARIIKNLRNILKRQRKLYSTNFDSSARATLCSNHAQLHQPSTTRTTRTTATCGRTVSSLPTCLDDYRPFILTFRSEVIAQQFCMMEQEMLQWVTWDELAELRWRKRSKGTVISPDIEQSSLQDGVEQLIGFFNKTCQWVASEIVRTRSMDIRIRVIEKFIRIALKCYHHRNYSTLMQILLGLQAPAVSRLEKTWQRIDHYEMQIFNELKELAKPFRNWKNVRDAMTKAIHEIAESSAVESVLTKDIFDDDNVDGCIPFLGKIVFINNDFF